MVKTKGEIKMKTNKIKEENKTDDEKNKEIIIWDEAYINEHDDGVKQATADFIEMIDKRKELDKAVLGDVWINAEKLKVMLVDKQNETKK